MDRRVVTVFGAGGFLGRHLVRRLAKSGAIVRAAVPDPEAASYLKPMGEVGQVVPIAADLNHAGSVAHAVAGAEAVVNLVGILYERGRRSFQAIHVEGAKRVAEAAKAAGAKRLVHVSALGADSQSDSAYAKSKAEGEAAVKAAFPQATILRPSVVFGPEDGFFNRFGQMAALLPALPVYVADGFKVRIEPWELEYEINLFGSGGPKFQPVYVGDVADALMAALERPDAPGQTFELAGPRAYSMRAIMELVARETRRDNWLLPLPYWVGKIQAFFLQFLPNPPLTPDQMKLLRHDNIAGGTVPGLAALGIDATAIEAIVPGYLARYRPATKRTMTLEAR
jgi:uncharacterized protein YbjT (DUF2867 family)